MYADDVIGGVWGRGGAEIAYYKKSHMKLFDGAVEYERYFWYLRYASMNKFIHLADVYWDKTVQLLLEDNEPRVRKTSEHRAGALVSSVL